MRYVAADEPAFRELTFWTDEDSAYGYLAEFVRDRWDNVRFDFDGVPAVPPANDRDAVEIYYGVGRSDDSYSVYSETAERHMPERAAE